MTIKQILPFRRRTMQAILDQMAIELADQLAEILESLLQQEANEFHGRMYEFAVKGSQPTRQVARSYAKTFRTHAKSC